MLMKIEWYETKTNGNNIVKIDVNNLTNEEKKEEYKTEISKEIDRVKQKNTAQEIWNTICKICKETRKKVLGIVKRKRQHKDEEIQQLSEKAKKKRKEIEAANDEVVRKRKKEALKEIKSKIKTNVKQLDDEKLDKKLKQIEKCKNDSTRYYAAMEEIKKSKNCERQRRNNYCNGRTTNQSNH